MSPIPRIQAIVCCYPGLTILISVCIDVTKKQKREENGIEY